MTFLYCWWCVGHDPKSELSFPAEIKTDAAGLKLVSFEDLKHELLHNSETLKWESLHKYAKMWNLVLQLYLFDFTKRHQVCVMYNK